MKNMFFVTLLTILPFSFVSAHPDSFKVDFRISKINSLAVNVIASYDSSAYGEYHPCRTAYYDRRLKVTQTGSVFLIKDEMPFISKSGLCKARFDGIAILIKNEAGHTEMISFIARPKAALTPEKLSVKCLQGAIKRTTLALHTSGVWSDSYMGFVCNSFQSKDSVAIVFSFDPMKPFKLKDVSISYSSESVPDFSTVLATEIHGPFQFQFSQNNHGLVGAYSPVKVVGIPAFENIKFIVTSVSFAKNVSLKIFMG